MRSSTLIAVLALLTTAALSLTACDSDGHDSADSPGSATATTTSSTSSTITPTASTPAALDDPDGPNDTIASYIKSAGIEETSVKPGEDGAPYIDLRTPDGWTDAGDKTPENAAGAIVYTGPEAHGADYTPNIIAILSRLTGDVDSQKLIDLAGGEMRNLPGFRQISAGGTATMSGFPAYRIAGTYNLRKIHAVTAQQTVVIPSPDAVYVLQFNATSNEDQAAALLDATRAIDANTTIYF